jgi:hypothetical protein
MKRLASMGAALGALYELARYDLLNRFRGPAHMDRRLGPQPVDSSPVNAEMVAAICNAVLLAASLYCKPVLCLQRSVCTVRLLRKRGIDARLVIGCCPAPFFSHAWVEVDGKIVNDSPAYPERLQVLYTA